MPYPQRPIQTVIVVTVTASNVPQLRDEIRRVLLEPVPTASEPMREMLFDVYKKLGRDLSPGV